ncbi:helix-turn-helix domain-containing protein [Cryobacterium mannosilyticum]|uniref:DNA-binding protein n=1 Tax=Cryobacterium mannosilyticum TaxID=1259190 RepID=A0A4R8WAH4_9MICO|nr:helix-turn-helix domain-containing protein [Cryobacterium mannosilyticum]TFC03644.1 DNA-binding protein [Cryobacterium mannosilyticum]
MTEQLDPQPSTIEALIRQVVREEVRAQRDADAARARPEVAIVDPLRLYSVTAASGILAMSKVWVYKQIREGHLPVVEFGHTRPHQRIRAVDLQRFIEDRVFLCSD